MDMITEAGFAESARDYCDAVARQDAPLRILRDGEDLMLMRTSAWAGAPKGVSGDRPPRTPRKRRGCEKDPFALVFCEDDVRWLVERMLGERYEPVGPAEDEADRSYLTALVAFVCEVKGFPAKTNDFGDPENRFVVMRKLASFEPDVLNIMIARILAKGMFYDKSAHRFEEHPGIPKRPYGLCALEWGRFCRVERGGRASSRERCRILIERLCREDGGVFFDALVESMAEGAS